MSRLKLRKRASLMDKLFIISVIATVLGVVGLVVTGWFSPRFNDIAHADEHEVLSTKLKSELLAAQEEKDQLRSTIASAEDRDRQTAKVVVEQEKQLAAARERNAQLEKQLEAAQERNGQISKELEAAKEHAQTFRKESTGRAPPNEIARSTEQTVPEALKSERRAQIAAHIAKFSPAKAAIYYLEEAPDGALVAASLSSALSEGGWESAIWKWTGVSGIVGLVVLTKEGNNSVVDSAATAFVEACRSAGFNAAKADWPADWVRYRGVLVGSQAPAPTEAPIRIVIGVKSF